MKLQNEKCYMCNSEATSREHAPPKSFFPAKNRSNLITVPSCSTHNNDNSKDVEYVYSFICSPIQTKEIAREQFSKVLRAFKRNPNLKNLVYKDSEPIFLPNGQETGLVKIDLDRFKSVMRAIAYAIYYYSFNKKYFGSFDIFGTNLVPTKELSEENNNELSNIRQMLSQLKFTSLNMPEPEVFGCAVHQENSEKFIYEFTFYGGFKIHAVSIPFYYKTFRQINLKVD